MALPFVPKRRSGPIRVGAAIAVAAVGLAIAGGYALYRSHEASVAEEARRTAEAQQAAQQRQEEQNRAAIETAKREAAMQAELKAAKDALESAAASKTADEQRELAEAPARRVAEAAPQKTREGQNRVAAVSPQPTTGAPPVTPAAPAVAAAAPAAPDRYDGIYSGQLCNTFVEPEPKTVCWGVAMKIEQGVVLASWMNQKAGLLDSAKGKISPQGKVDLTLEGHAPNGNIGHGLMMGTVSGSELTASGAWQNGLRVTGKWTRTP